VSLPFIPEPKKEEEPFQKKEDWIVELVSPPPTSRTEERTKQKDKISDFQKLYLVDSLTFGFVNFLVHKIISKILFTGSPEDVKAFEDWADKIDLRIKLEDIVQDIIVCGGAWTEMVYSSIDLEDIKIINPETMDYIRDDQENIKLDDEGKFLGLVQEINGKKRYWYKDRIEESNNILYKAEKGEDLRDRIKYWKLISFGESELGISFIKPVYRSAIIRSNLEDMIGESGFRGGGIVAYLTGEPSQEQKRNLKEQLTNITSRNIFLLKDNIKLSTIPIPELSAREQLLYSLADFQASGLGIPLEALVSGTKTYRQDFINKMADMESRIESYQARLAEQIQEYIIVPLLHLWKRKGPVKIQFASSSTHTQMNRSRVIATLARRGLISRDPELELHLRKELKLPTSIVEVTLDNWIKNKKESPQDIVDKEIDVGQ
jgi:hypothetical protein